MSTGDPHRRRVRVGRVLVGLVLTLAAVEYGVLPSLMTARHDIGLMGGASMAIMCAALAVEGASLAAYTAMTRAVTPREVRLGWGRQLGIDLTGYGVSHVVPGGTATAAALRVRMMARSGVPAPVAVTTAMVQVTLADLVLVACYITGVALIVPRVASQPALVVLAAVGATVLVLALVAGRELRRRPAGSAPVEQLRQLLDDERQRSRALAWAAANWAFDVACLWLCLAAYGELVHPGVVLVAYGVANLLGLLPVTPGGLGIVEGVLIPFAIGLGVDGAVAVLGVLSWRVLQFWLPVPVAAVAYASVRWGEARDACRALRPDVAGRRALLPPATSSHCGGDATEVAESTDGES